MNCLLAGAAGGVTAIILKSVIDYNFKGKLESNYNNKLKSAYDFST